MLAGGAQAQTDLLIAYEDYLVLDMPKLDRGIDKFDKQFKPLENFGYGEENNDMWRYNRLTNSRGAQIDAIYYTGDKRYYGINYTADWVHRNYVARLSLRLGASGQIFRNASS